MTNLVGKLVMLSPMSVEHGTEQRILMVIGGEKHEYWYLSSLCTDKAALVRVLQVGEKLEIR
jgi:hypothetical protein